MEDLIRVLEKTVSNSQSDQNEAVRFIQDYVQRDFTGFLKALSDVLYEQQNSPVVRAAAGLQLKNQLTARDEALRQLQQDRWRSLPQETRHYIKERVFRALGTEIFRPSSAPQCVAYIAIVELPEQLWPGVIEALTQNVTNPNGTPQLRLASLEAIGYICQEIDQSCLQTADSDRILTAIVIHGMRETEIDDVKLAATTALLNSLEFTESNFAKEMERDHIMQAVCNATQSANTHISVAALQCLVKIMSLYYQYMEKYMPLALYAITTEAMKSDNDDIALQGIEFWSNVCDEEIQLAGDCAEAQELGEQPERISKQYALQALPSLVPILVEMLSRQDENDDSEDWKPCKSAGVCLMLLANCCENAIVGYVLPYITQNVHSDDWRCRDAAVMTFGSILDGPDTHTLQPIAVQIVPYLIRFMRDSSVVVRDTAAWAIGKLCDTVPDAVLSLPEFLDTLVQALAENLDSEPRVASNVCWAINSLVTAAGERAREHLSEDVHPDTFLLSNYYTGIIQGLLRTTERQDNAKDQEHNLRSASYEALMAVIKAAPADCYTFVYPTTFNMILQRIQSLHETIIRPEMRAPEIRAQLHDFLSLLWTTLASCIKRMDKSHTTAMSDNVMQNLLMTLNNSVDASATQEDVFMAAASLLEAVGKYFSRYMDVFKPYLIVGLTNSANPQLNSTVIGLLSDLARTLGEDLFPHCADFMQALLVKLREEHYDKNAKAQILSVYGDFALAFGPKFQPWISTCLDMLHQASSVQTRDRSDYDQVDYCIKLRECTIEGYVGIIQGMKDKAGRPTAELSQVLPRVPLMIQFIESLANDPDLTDSLLGSCLGLIGDIVENFGTQVTHLVNSENIKELIMKGKKSRSEKTQTFAIWANNMVRKVSKNRC